MLRVCRIFAATSIFPVTVVTVLLALVAESPAQSLGDLSVQQICRYALDPLQTAWDQNFAKYVAETARRGLTVESCRQLLAPTPTSSPRASTDPLLFWLYIILTGFALPVIGLVWLFNRSHEAEAPDEAAARVLADKTDVAVATPTENLTSEIEQAKAKQLEIARSWIRLFTVAATCGLWLVFVKELNLNFYISWVLGFVVAFVLSRILALYVGMYLGKKYARELKSRFGGGVASNGLVRGQ
jgi:hypothetical protein